jgi:hypothetical protein
VRYVRLPKRFILGEVVLSDKKGECAKGVRVQLDDGAETIECRTDSFGDFEFDGLKTSKTYRLRITHGGYATVEKPVVTHSDVNVGVIELDPSS